MIHTGSCLCGAVTYEVDGPLRDVIDCHCIRCRRHSGHHMAATAAATTDVAIDGHALCWYAATDTVEYGFCRTCGSSLFWRTSTRPETLSIAAGTLDPPTGLRTTAAIYTSQASDYHRLDPQIDRSPEDR